jgi:formylglycine-generating enzyme required for sulfatase activity
MHAAATMSSPAPDRAWPPEPQRRPPLFPPACAFAWGDDRHGLWIDVDVGGAVQRFRWIEPGEFWMGSPEGEPERDNDEGPRHVVRLTAGFWLADTACAQAVWQAVMGDNPSRLKDDPQNPVEQVSWDDVQDFLGRVKEQFLGMQASLPSEAEWEYACRAGTDTAFNVGDSLSREQANYDGTKAYASGPTGEYRQRTVAVKHFEANAWGLYQMHGNVWEWCADGQRAYDNSLQVDPRGPDEAEAVRVVRGGSWLSVPWGLRSAYRGRRPRGLRHDSRGFRFSLRSTRPEEGAERLPEADVTRPA